MIRNISGLTLLGILLIVLKVSGVIGISWWLVLLPFYGGFLVGCVILALIVWHYGKGSK